MTRYHVAWLTLALMFASLTDARMAHQLKGRRAEHALGRRQGILVTGTATETTGAAMTAAQTTDAATTTDGGLLASLLHIGDLTATTTLSTADTDSIIIVTTSSSSSSSTQQTSSTTSSVVTSSSSSSSTATSTATSTLKTSSVQPTVTSLGVVASTVDITSTQSVDTPSSSASASASAAADSSDGSSNSGVAKKTIIIIAAVAGSVGLIAAIWTLFRKWKLSPSRRFESRLKDIDWTADLPHNGSAAMASSDSFEKSTLGRSESWDSAKESQRGAAMSETGFGSQVTATSPTGVIPALPPGYGRPGMNAATVSQHSYPQIQQQYLHNPYEQVQRQASQVHGGRYGEGYLTR